MSKPEIFIIESLRFEEEASLCEGKIISQILAMSDKQCEYYYIRSKKELKRVLHKFNQSRYRYLHLSCHADKESMTTTIDEVAFKELAKMLKGNSAHCRVFLSACSMATEEFAEAIFSETDFISVLGPTEDIPFGDAVVFWSSLYHMMFKQDPDRMEGAFLRSTAQALVNVHGIRLKYFGKDTEATDGIKVYPIVHRAQIG
jgi:hypothetical protein